MKHVIPGLILLGCCSLVAIPCRSATQQKGKAEPPEYTIRGVTRPVRLMIYRREGPPTMVNFLGTALMPQAHGEAKVYRSDQGFVVEMQAQDLKPPRDFGARFLTYVLWALTPDGEAHNLGKLQPSKGKAKLEVATGLDNFGMVVTAEPDFAVSKPSELVVMDNVSYLYATTGKWLPPTMVVAPLDSRIPLDLYEARAAMRTARAEGAQQYAPARFRQAITLLEQAENQYKHSKDKLHLDVIETARKATRAAEAARAETADYLAKQRQRNAQGAQVKGQGQAQAMAQAEADAEPDDDPGEAASSNQPPTAQIRSELRRQLQTALATRATPRGLVIPLADALFETNEARLRDGAREKLAKISGILLAHPGVTVEVNGYPGKKNRDASWRLAEKRAAAVRDYLIHQGLPSEAIRAADANGDAGDGDPSAGDGSERGVEMVVSGAPIGL